MVSPRHAHTPPLTYATVPELWPGRTVVIAASGPSLCAEDVACCRGAVPVIAVKDAIRLAPDAEILYGCDAAFWARAGGYPGFRGLKFSIDPNAAPHGVHILKYTGVDGLERDRAAVRHGHNSTYQALHVAIHAGARCVLLLGADMGHGVHGPKYFYGDRIGQVRSPFALFLASFATLVEPLAAAGIEVLNCSRASALTCFPRVPLVDALARARAA